MHVENKEREIKVSTVTKVVTAKVPVGVETAEVQAVSAPAPAPEPTPPSLTDHQQVLQAAGVPSQDWPAADYIFTHESSWQPAVRNNEGCLGLGQRCPASVLLGDCPDLKPVCQVKHFNTYAIARYGGWWGAYDWWLGHKWW